MTVLFWVIVGCVVLGFVIAVVEALTGKTLGDCSPQTPSTPRTDAFLKATTPVLRLKDDGAQADETDIVPEGLGYTRWPSATEINKVRLANPDLPESQVFAVAVARTRLVGHS